MKTKHIQKSDFLFFILVTLGIGIFLALLHTMPSCIDESFYPSIALRLINGDSLITDEWHLSQFSSLFLYLPVRLWLTIKGSTDGIIIFLRCCFLLLHTITAFIVYGKFRKHGIWAVFAALFFFLQAPMRVYSLSYNSLFSFFLLMVVLLLYTIYTDPKPILYILTGFFYGAACVCNPFFCLVFFAYCITCLVLYCLQNPKKGKREPHSFSVYPIFFSNKVFLLFFFGITIIALIAIVFFFATGGTLLGIGANLKNLTTDIEHNIFTNPILSFLQKAWDTCRFFNDLSMHLPFLLPGLYIALFLDKKKYDNKHRVLYLLLALALAVFYTITIATLSPQSNNAKYFFWTLPFLIISTVSFILTKNKNKSLFFCMWTVGAVAAVTQYMASNLHLLPLGWAMAVSNTAGVFFIKDLFAELKAEKETIRNILSSCSQAILCFTLCANLVLQCFILCYDLPRIYNEKNVEITQGAYNGIAIEKRIYGTHSLLQKDLAVIHKRSNEDDPVLVITNLCWLQLELDRPMAAYSAWQMNFEPDRMLTYFEQNPDKKPKYIYIAYILNPDYDISLKMAEDRATTMKSMFNCKEEKLSRGILLTVIE